MDRLRPRRSRARCGRASSQGTRAPAGVARVPRILAAGTRWCGPSRRPRGRPWWERHVCCSPSSRCSTELVERAKGLEPSTFSLGRALVHESETGRQMPLSQWLRARSRPKLAGPSRFMHQRPIRGGRRCGWGNTLTFPRNVDPPKAKARPAGHHECHKVGRRICIRQGPASGSLKNVVT